MFTSSCPLFAKITSGLDDLEDSDLFLVLTVSPPPGNQGLTDAFIIGDKLTANCSVLFSMEDPAAG